MFKGVLRVDRGKRIALIKIVDIYGNTVTFPVCDISDLIKDLKTATKEVTHHDPTKQEDEEDHDGDLG